MIPELIGLAREGFGSFYRGLFPSLLSVMPQSGLNFAIFTTISQFREGNDSFVAGLLAGGLSKLAVLPLDHVKRRCQVSSSSSLILGL